MYVSDHAHCRSSQLSILKYVIRSMLYVLKYVIIKAQVRESRENTDSRRKTKDPNLDWEQQEAEEPFIERGGGCGHG